MKQENMFNIPIHEVTLKIPLTEEDFINHVKWLEETWVERQFEREQLELNQRISLFDRFCKAMEFKEQEEVRDEYYKLLDNV